MNESAPDGPPGLPPESAIVRSEIIRVSERTIALRLIDGAGRSGWGECSPLPGRSSDGTAECAAALENALASLASWPPPARAAVVTAARVVAGALQSVDRSLPAARFALETALLDLAAQALGVPVAELFRPGRAGGPVACSAVVPPSGEGAPPGIATWKVKIGDPSRLDRDLSELRRCVPAGVRLRLDINRGWTGAQAADLLPRLVELGPEWVEEPTDAAQLLELAAAARPPVPLALDESVCDQESATGEALERGLVRALVLKPALLGGLTVAAAWAERARRAGVVPIVSHLFDGPIALAAYAELAVALARDGDPAAGLGPHAGLAVLPGVRAPQLVGGSHLVSRGPGLGVEL